MLLSLQPGTEACDLPFEAIEHVYPFLQDATRSNQAGCRGLQPKHAPRHSAPSSPSSPDKPGVISRSQATPHFRHPLRRLLPSLVGAWFRLVENNALVETAAVQAVTKRYQRQAGLFNRSRPRVAATTFLAPAVPKCGISKSKALRVPNNVSLHRQRLHVATSDVAFVLALVTSALTQEPEILEWPFSELYAAFTFNPITTSPFASQWQGSPNPALHAPE